MNRMLPQDSRLKRDDRPAFVIGITGGMACGKSAAAEVFRRSGFGCVDCDEIVRELLAEKRDVCRAVRERFGDSVMDSKGAVSRSALAEVVFASSDDLDWLENLLHPKVIGIWQERTAAGPEPMWAVEIPLLFEKGLEKHVDVTVCIAASPRVQRERLRLRGMNDEQANSRTYRQYSIEVKMELADHVVLNDGSERFLREQVLDLIRNL